MFATIRGHELWYERHGTASTGRPRLLLLMGFGMSGKAWRPLARELAAVEKIDEESAIEKLEKTIRAA